MIIYGGTWGWECASTTHVICGIFFVLGAHGGGTASPPMGILGSSWSYYSYRSYSYKVYLCELNTSSSSHWFPVIIKCPALTPKVYSSMAGRNVGKILSIMASVILLVLFIINGRGPKLSLGTVIINRRESSGSRTQLFSNDRQHPLLYTERLMTSAALIPRTTTWRMIRPGCECYVVSTDELFEQGGDIGSY